MNEHGHCPNCNVDLNGGSIWDHFYKKTGDEKEADRSAEMYGATREHGQWGREIGIYDMERDITAAWRCPDCQHEWKR
jgi:hypothetical protein